MGPRGRLGLALIGVGFSLFMIGPVVVVLLGGFALAVVPALVAFALMAVGGIVMTSDGSRPRAARTATAPGVLRLSCPNCGATPSGAVGAGITTCEYCGTRYLIEVAASG